MELTDLKRPKKEKGEGEEMPATVGEEDRYPYGLRITLEKEELEKLDLKPNDFDAGAECTFMAKGKVEEIAQRETTREDGGRKSISIQITAMALSKPKAKKKSGAETYFDTKAEGPGGEA